MFCKLNHVCTNLYIHICLFFYTRINAYQFVLLYSICIGDWVYKLFMHQACVFLNQQQYNNSNQLLTHILHEAYQQGVICVSLKEAFEAFQAKLNNKQHYLAFWVRKTIPNCYDTMTTSPVESINSHIKHRLTASSLNNFSCSLIMITDGMHKFIYTNWYFVVTLSQFVYMC